MDRETGRGRWVERQGEGDGYRDREREMDRETGRWRWIERQG